MAFSAVAAAAAVVGAGTAVYGARKSAKASKKAAQAQRRQEQIQSRSSRRSALRRARLARATAINAGVQVGGRDGSGLAGGTGALSSRLGTSLGEQGQLTALSGQIGRFGQQAQRGQTISGFGSSLFNLSAPYAIGGAQNFFGGGSTTTFGGPEPTSFAPVMRP